MADPTKSYGKATRVPAIPDIRTGTVESILAKVKEWIEVREGARGDGLDKAVTFRDLLNTRIAGPGDINGAVEGIPPIPLLPGDNDPAIPPTPTDLSATGTLFHILLSWEFARGYSRLAYFEVWRSATDALGSAVLIGQTFSPNYADQVEPESTFYYWVRAVSDAGKSPFNAVAGTRAETPFFLQGEETEVNGEPVLPRMYLKDGYIMNGVITNAKIGNLAVDDAKIANMNVVKLTAGALSVGAYIESTNYVSGDTGWSIHSNGNAEFLNATVRGTVLALAGVIGGVSIRNNGLSSSNYNGTSDGSDNVTADGNAGWVILANGNVVFNNGTFRGALDAATGSFAGSLSAATGSFTGHVSGGYFTTGNFTGYAWPPAGGTGTYLGPSGFLMGNLNDGRYVQINPQGNFYAPGLQIVNGVMTISAIDVIDTLQIAGNAVTVPTGNQATSTVSLTKTGWTELLSVTHNGSGYPTFIMCTADADAKEEFTYEGDAWTMPLVVQTRLTLNDVEIAVSGSPTLTYRAASGGSGTYKFFAKIQAGSWGPGGLPVGEARRRTIFIMAVKR